MSSCFVALTHTGMKSLIWVNPKILNPLPRRLRPAQPLVAQQPEHHPAYRDQLVL